MSRPLSLYVLLAVALLAATAQAQTPRRFSDINQQPVDAAASRWRFEHETPLVPCRYRVVAVSPGLIAWRGDRLRSPGVMDSPISREGAFLANNVLFAAFAFVVLLGTIFPLIVEAIDGRTISVGNPYFERMTMPIGFVLLFLMAIAPVLPSRTRARYCIFSA